MASLMNSCLRMRGACGRNPRPRTSDKHSVMSSTPCQGWMLLVKNWERPLWTPSRYLPGFHSLHPELHLVCWVACWGENWTFPLAAELGGCPPLTLNRDYNRPTSSVTLLWERLTSLPEEHRLTGLRREERPLLSYKPESIAPSTNATFLQKLALWWVFLACSPKIWQWDTAEESIPHTAASFSILGSASTTVKPPRWPRLQSTFLFNVRKAEKQTRNSKAAPGRLPHSLPLSLAVTDFNLQDSLCSGEPLQGQNELETVK